MLSQSQLTSQLGPVLADMGFALLGSESFRAHQGTGLRLYIDKPEGVTCDDCVKAGEQAQAVLSVVDPQYNQYILEVSSPGLDRPLFKAADYQQFIGQTVKLQLKQPLGNRRRWQATLLEVCLQEPESQSTITIQATDDPSTHRIAFHQIDKARLVPQLGES